MRRAAVALVLCAALGHAGADTVREDPREREMLEIAAQLRCAVCQNESVAESHADLARDMRALIREQLAAGRSEEEIVAFFRQRYGDYVLMRPPAEGAGTLLWIAPALLLAAAGVGAVLYLRRRARSTTGAGT